MLTRRLRSHVEDNAPHTEPDLDQAAADPAALAYIVSASGRSSGRCAGRAGVGRRDGLRPSPGPVRWPARSSSAKPGCWCTRNISVQEVHMTEPKKAKPKKGNPTWPTGKLSRSRQSMAKRTRRLVSNRAAH
jgi:hypothetical protein